MAALRYEKCKDPEGGGAKHTDQLNSPLNGFLCQRGMYKKKIPYIKAENFIYMVQKHQTHCDKLQ